MCDVLDTHDLQECNQAISAGSVSDLCAVESATDLESCSKFEEIEGPAAEEVPEVVAELACAPVFTQFATQHLALLGHIMEFVAKTVGALYMQTRQSEDADDVDDLCKNRLQFLWGQLSSARRRDLGNMYHSADGDAGVLHSLAAERQLNQWGRCPAGSRTCVANSVVTHTLVVM
eukprot:CAMPEP_0179288286 /NCGR_PEP_ID=MMETSP0797-20121207/40705_1 /TAXON_ID=47934 /ORGANISM="Dinophysis acuminata, Strain DAEP01" /LENGTH=174 /DNA_ID=CAMNT_0020997249 /DNA_START=157 /DNA_END=678 /DNA_ORIENTATION=+